MFLKKIRELREERGLTQQQLAQIMNIPLPTYNKYEAGLRIIPTELLIRIADYFEVSIDYLTERTQERNMNR